MQDRGHEKEGAWEFVEPLAYLILMAVLAKSIADNYWKVPSNKNSEIVNDDLFSEWMITERQAIVARRNKYVIAAFTLY